MITITKYVSNDGVEWTNQFEAEQRDALLILAEKLQRAYEADDDWLALAVWVRNNFVNKPPLP